MAFSYRPLPFDDPQPVNRVAASLQVAEGVPAVLDALGSAKGMIVLDGFPGARFEVIVAGLRRVSPVWELVDASTLYTAALDELIASYLPMDRETDPELIFGRLFDKGYYAILDPEKVADLLRGVAVSGRPTLIYGLGAAAESLRKHASAVFFIDVTPKDVALRVHDGRYRCLGAGPNLDVDTIARQTYFVDVELAVRLRKELVVEDQLAGYILDSERSLQIMSWSDLRAVLDELRGRPLRAKPVYVEGVWGGQFVKRLRGIPDDMVDKVAWAFDLIPTEASLLIESGPEQIDVPFMTVMDAVGEHLIGDVLYRRFDGRFPVRFNYDDTWHSNGNMSVQVHPSDDMIQQLHGDIEAQNEAYYIVLTGHGAKTYCGFKGDGHRFLELCRQSERDGSEVPYQDYIHSVESEVGRQIFLPHGTIHSSGRNQLVLELGTITSGAYTYKIYDYNRPDITGKPRPIHTKLAGLALAYDRDAEWVGRHIAFPPRLVAEGPGWVDYLVGRYDGMYIDTHRIEIAAGQSYAASNTTGFTVLALVDGESAHIRTDTGEYQAGYLDVILVPASAPDYTVLADPRHPIVIHKTLIREDRFQAWQTS